MRFTYVASLALCAALIPGAALAHVDLITPPPRQAGQAGGNQLKLKPCGQTTNQRTNKVTTYAPGQQVEIKMKEYVDHPGYFAVAFDEEGDDSFVFPRPDMDDVNPETDDPKMLFPVDGLKVLGIRLDKDKNCASEPDQTCTMSIKIPNVNCQNCTLQLTQFMYDKVGDNNDNEYYYQCADIKIEGPLAPSGGAGGMGGGGAGGSAGVATGGTGGSPTGGVPTGGTGGAPSGGTPGASGSSTTAGAPPSGGAPTAGSGAGGASAGTTTSTTAPVPSDDGGCAVSRPSRGAASVLAALGLACVALRRRRVAV